MKILGIDTGLGNAFLVKTPKAQTTKLKKQNKTTYQQVRLNHSEKLLHSKRSNQQDEKQLTEQEKNICKPYTE